MHERSKTKCWSFTPILRMHCLDLQLFVVFFLGTVLCTVANNYPGLITAISSNCWVHFFSSWQISCNTSWILIFICDNDIGGFWVGPNMDGWMGCFNVCADCQQGQIECTACCLKLCNATYLWMWDIKIKSFHRPLRHSRSRFLLLLATRLINYPTSSTASHSLHSTLKTLLYKRCILLLLWACHQA